MTEVMFKSCLFLDQLSFWAPPNHEPACQLLLTLHYLWTLLHANALAHIFLVLPCRRIPANVTATALLSEERRTSTDTTEAISGDLATTLELARREIYPSHDARLALLRCQMHILLVFLLVVNARKFGAPSHGGQWVYQTCHMLLDVEGDVGML